MPAECVETSLLFMLAAYFKGRHMYRSEVDLESISCSVMGSSNDGLELCCLEIKSPSTRLLWGRLGS